MTLGWNSEYFMWRGFRRNVRPYETDRCLPKWLPAWQKWTAWRHLVTTCS